ncbi:MAG: hypothetical protein KBB75_00770 [Candidatus Pacebacteria bacterium]|jgi:cell fate (sporulation/competence/biofilm development) regulator YlbF (YheA/YmcA/DUF963 family)|nr:hypothetical protein [Candidatus Paceibacterota bacterium]
MSFKSFITKKVLQMRGVSADQADAIAQKLADNPEIAESLKALESNKEVKELFEKIQKEVEEKKKAGTPDVYASILVMKKYQAQITKHRDILEPVMRLMQK